MASLSLEMSWSTAAVADQGDGCAGEGRWLPQHALGGHYGAVVDMCWGVDGACLFTASEDQTARIFAEFRGLWCEIARPQVPSLQPCVSSGHCICTTAYSSRQSANQDAERNILHKQQPCMHAGLCRIVRLYMQCHVCLSWYAAGVLLAISRLAA